MQRIVLAEDMHMIRAALAALLDLEPDMEVVAQADRGADAVAAVLRTGADTAVLDIDMPGMDGITAAARLREQAPECRTLILTGMGRPGQLWRALDAKVCGFLVKDASSEELIGAVRRVGAGRRVIDPELAISAWEIGDNPLTARESEMLTLVGDGVEAAQIACATSLSVGTVRNYLTAIVNKLGARNRVDALRVARENGWLA
ncbi:response regulator transcription factor [Streptomyces jumonjinensis]|uniref:Response regulator transcription factor n=1 Tax=Streptomyces jumonjinensis TaxID=1945 RepID=A0A646KD56_STRJU|nr:response regulator transcription factor [Streptomyces jumonjinensis]MQS98925.1 response regulator transcription factor [Streptomyces jumonjinensis]